MTELFRLDVPLDLFLIRHPRPAVDPSLCYGASDLPLAEDAATCAGRLAPLLPRDARVISSPMVRARLLAEALSTEAIIEPRLRELDFGDWEMKPFSDIPPEGFDVWGRTLIDFRAPGGELYADMAARVWAAFNAHRPNTASLVIVAHNGPLSALAGTLLGLPSNRWLNLEFDFAHLTHLAIGPLGAKLRAMNR